MWHLDPPDRCTSFSCNRCDQSFRHAMQQEVIKQANCPPRGAETKNAAHKSSLIPIILKHSRLNFDRLRSRCISNAQFLRIRCTYHSRPGSNCHKGIVHPFYPAAASFVARPFDLRNYNHRKTSNRLPRSQCNDNNQRWAQAQEWRG